MTKEAIYQWLNDESMVNKIVRELSSIKKSKFFHKRESPHVGRENESTEMTNGDVRKSK